VEPIAPETRWPRRTVLLVALVIAAISARPYAGSWNDGSRLATVESLVDRDTLQIDESIFVKVPPLVPGKPSPYPRDFELLQDWGTKDKMYIGGHFYSDKSPVPALPMAAVYQVWRWCGGPSAAERPDWYCLLMTWTSSGLAFVIAICCFEAMGRRLGLGPVPSIGLTLAFALGTIAAPYAQHVNNHILLLAVAAVLFLSLMIGIKEGWPARRLLRIGALAGIGYTIDLAAGPLLCLAIGGFLLWSLPKRARIAWVIFAAAPFVIAHHVVNYEIGGTIGPANAVPEHFQWPGSPFVEANMTGGWHHSSVGKGIRYAFDMLFGKKGYLGHNLLLFLPLVYLPVLTLRSIPERPLLIAGTLWATGTWLLYSATSTNQSGGCCSVRWFVPLLAPGFFALCVTVRERPETTADATTLGIGSALFGPLMIVRGPWNIPNLTAYWIIYAVTLTGWAIVHNRESRRRNWQTPSIAEESKNLSFSKAA
jgi:hypothetical protein